MSGMDGVKREIRRLRRNLDERDFRAGAPALDQDGLPMWDGGEPLTTEGYAKALGDSLDSDLTPQELEARNRLGPYIEVFETLQRDENEEAGP